VAETGVQTWRWSCSKSQRMPAWLGFLVTVVAALSAQGAVAAGADRLVIAVSVPPQAYFVDRIGGDRIETVVMIPPGASDETYAPTPAQMVSLSKARLYVTVGHPDYLFERRYINPFLQTHPEVEVVSMAEGVEFISMRPSEEGRVEHPGAEERYETDPHIWVAPDPVRMAVRNIARALSTADPAHAAEYQENLVRFLADIDALNQDVRAQLAGTEHRKVIVTHPAWGYLTNQFGLEQIAIEADGKEPGPARIIALIETARRERVKTVFVQKGFSRKSAELIATAIDGQVVEIDPLAYDWLANTRAVAVAFRVALQP